jgi:membrane protein implicated in regulation of membrane protease activity
MILVSLLGLSFPVQLLIWLIISSVLLYFTRPYALGKLKVGKVATNVDSLVGKSALVVKTITKHDKGEIKINGIIWSAKTEDDAELAEGSECEIVAIQGATAIVT